MSFGQTLRTLMHEKRDSVVALSKAIGVGRATIYKWLSDETVPSAGNYKALARYYGVPVYRLQSGDLEAEPAAEVDWDLLFDIEDKITTLFAALGIKPERDRYKQLARMFYNDFRGKGINEKRMEEWVSIISSHSK